MSIAEKREGKELQFFNLSQQIVENECGYKLYDVEYISGSSTLRVYIMDPKTKTAVIEDCVKVDRSFTPYCESEAWIPEDFVLEVSSPGMFRNLKTKEHYEWAMSEYVLLKVNPHLLEDDLREQLKSMGALTKLAVRGIVKQVNSDSLEVELDSERIVIPFDVIKKANLDPDVDHDKE